MTVDDPIDHIIAVRHPLLQESPPGNVVTFHLTIDDPDMILNLSIRRQYQFVEVQISATRVAIERGSRWLHLIRTDGTVHLTGESFLEYKKDFSCAKILTHSAKLERGDEYSFYTVLSRSKELRNIPRVLTHQTTGTAREEIDTAREETTLKDLPESSKRKFNDDYQPKEAEPGTSKRRCDIYTEDVTRMLLRDIQSVDTRFIFTHDKTAGLDLWAHRSVLSPLHVFGYLLEHSKRNLVRSVGVDSEFWPLTVKIDCVSLSTFCALLMFVYTGTAEYTIDPRKFVLSKHRPTLKPTDSAVRDKSSYDWNPSDLVKEWNSKEVTLEELREAAYLYKVEDLVDDCDHALKCKREKVSKLEISTSFKQVREIESMSSRVQE